MTLVEVMVAILVFLIIMVGGLNYFVLPQTVIVRQEVKRLALSNALQKMESLAALSFAQLNSSLNESGTSLTLGSVSASRQTTITEVDDPADGQGVFDGDGDLVDYKNVVVEISWNDGNSQVITLSTEVSKFGR